MNHDFPLMPKGKVDRVMWAYDEDFDFENYD